MSKPWLISRRRLLRGSGAMMALPLLDAMIPSTALAARRGRPPVRLAYVYPPSGIFMPDWIPTTEGRYKFPKTLSPLEPLKSEFLVLSQMALQPGYVPMEGHAGACPAYLTGVSPTRSAQPNVNGISIDHHVAKQLGKETYIDTLTLGLRPVGRGGNGNAGYSSLYWGNISWMAPNTPAPRETDPKVVFERMFRGRKVRLPRWDRQAGTSSGKLAENVRKSASPNAHRRSVLDMVKEDAQSLRADLGTADRQKLDQYLESVRSVEKQIEFLAKEEAEAAREAAGTSSSSAPGKLPSIKIPDQKPEDFEKHIRVMFDMMLLAFATDTTRVATFMIGREAEGRAYPQIGVKESHHECSHHGNEADKTTKYQKINQYHIEQFGYLMQKMKDFPEAGGCLLDNSLMVYGSGISDGQSHSHKNLPILLAGRGGGTVKPGRHIKCKKDLPVCNLHVELLNRVGVPTKKWGDSNGGVPGLA